MIKAYSYIRFSTPEQSRGDSLRRQTSKAEAWALQRGLVLDNSLRDLGVSAYHGANRTTGALRSFLDMVEKDQIERGSYLIVESLDRISRETVIDAATQLFALIQAGITVVTLSDGQEYSSERLRHDWTPLIISLAVMARAHDESRVKSERVGEAWRQKKKRAREEGKPLTPRCPEWLEVRDGKFQQRPERVEIVRRVFRETIDGFGRREIVRRLNLAGVPTFRGGIGWQTSSIAKIIQSRAVLGEYQPHRGTHKNRNRVPEGDPIPDFYPRIIEEETYWLAQTATEGRRHAASGRKGDKGSHILQGLAICTACSGPMHIVNKGRPPKGGVYLACSNNMRNAGCENTRRWRVDVLERDLLIAVDQLDAESLESLDNGPSKAAARVAALKAELADQQRRQKTLVPLVELGDETATERSMSLAKTIKITKAELKKAESEHRRLDADQDLPARIIEAATFSRTLVTLSEEDTEARREVRIRLRELLRRILQRVECDFRFGASVVFVPKLVWHHRTRGRSPYAVKITAQEGTNDGVAEVLLERDIDDELSDDWLGLSPEIRKWKKEEMARGNDEGGGS